MSSADLEKRVVELEETMKRQFNLTVIGIIAAVLVAVILWSVPSPKDIQLLDATAKAHIQIRNLATKVGMTDEELTKPLKEAPAPEASK